MISPEAKAFREELNGKYEDRETKEEIGKRLKENEFQLMALSRKMEPFTEKLEKYEKAVCQMDFLNSPEEIKKAASPKLLSTIAALATANFAKTKTEMNLLQLDYGLLELQREYLQKTLLKLR